MHLHNIGNIELKRCTLNIKVDTGTALKHKLWQWPHVNEPITAFTGLEVQVVQKSISTKGCVNILNVLS